MSGVLVLDESMKPIEMVSAERAITLIYEGKAQSLVDSDRVFRSVTLTIPVPEVIMLRVYVHLPSKMTARVSNVLLFARDSNTCVYCEKHKFGACGNPNGCGHCLPKGMKLTRDHMKPIAKHEGKTYAERRAKADTWDNCVTACSKCNNKKSDKLPYEAKMFPKRNGQPYAPKRPYAVMFKFAVRVNEAQWFFIEPWIPKNEKHLYSPRR